MPRVLSNIMAVLVLAAASTAALCGDGHVGTPAPTPYHACEVVARESEWIWDYYDLQIEHHDARECPSPTFGRETYGHTLYIPNGQQGSNQNRLAIRRPDNEGQLIITQVDDPWECPTGEGVCTSEQNVEFTANTQSPYNYNYADAYVTVNICCGHVAYERYRIVWGPAQ